MKVDQPNKLQFVGSLEVGPHPKPLSPTQDLMDTSNSSEDEFIDA